MTGSYAMPWGWGRRAWLADDRTADEPAEERRRDRGDRRKRRFRLREQEAWPDDCGPPKVLMGRGRGGEGPPPWAWGGPPFGAGGHPIEFLFRGPHHPRRGRGRSRGRRGDIRTGILLLLAEQPRSGYEIIREGRERSGGTWRPSSGSVYPMLQQLQDEGLVRPGPGGTEGRRRPFELTEDGRNYVEERGSELTPPWEHDAAEEEAEDRLAGTRDLAFQVLTAVMQVAQAGSPDQVRRADDILNDTRRALYRILAEDDRETDPRRDEDDGGTGGTGGAAQDD